MTTCTGSSRRNGGLVHCSCCYFRSPWTCKKFSIIRFDTFDTLLLFCQAQGIFHHHFFHHHIPPPPPPNSKAIAPSLKTISQKVDNFNVYNTEQYSQVCRGTINRNVFLIHFSQRYYSNLQFFQPGGPIFIMLGGEDKIDGGWLQTGQMFDMASQNGAAMFYPEHRYYGLSQPKR